MSVPKPPATQPLVRTLNVPEEQIIELLDRLDSMDASMEIPMIPGLKVFPYRLAGLVVKIEQPAGGGSTSFQVFGRYLGEHCISFLHGAFLHANTNCTVQLISRYGTWGSVPGTVASCSYVENKIHEVVVQFANRIDMALFSQSAVETRTLLVEDEPISAHVAMSYLARLNAKVTHVENGKLAVEKVQEENFDLIMMDMRMPVLDGFTAAKKLRDNGYSGIIVAVTALSEDQDREKCLEAGCDYYISKPYTKKDLEEVMKKVTEEPLYSTLAGQKNMEQIIEDFVSSLPKRIRTIEESLAKSDAQTIEALTRSLKADGSACGFVPITEAAATLEHSLRHNTALSEVRDQIIKLIRLCRSTRVV